MSDMTLWGFDGSTYVRTVKMVLAEKGVTDFKQVPLNVLKGEPKTPEHRERHPFGKVPVLDHDGVRILETTAIARYLNDVLPGKSLIPSAPKDRARMDMIIGLIDSYGYGALTGGVAAYHLFPDFVGGKNEAMRKGGLENGRKVLEIAMKTKGSSPFIAGDLSLADLYLAPIAFYVSLTPDKDALLTSPALRTGGRRFKPCQVSKTRNPISADERVVLTRRGAGTLRYIALSSVIGRSGTGLPVPLNHALATAAPTPVIPISPTPRAPTGA
jgi:glutathione S-transferase